VAGQPFYWLAGMFLLARADAFQAVGGFDERFFLYCEDYDLCARFYGAGYALASVPAASAVHDAQRDSHRAFKYLRWHVGSLLKVWTSRAFWRVTLDRRATHPDS
jgi:GT2 family glycosyltransferase